MKQQLCCITSQNERFGLCTYMLFYGKQIKTTLLFISLLLKCMCAPTASLHYLPTTGFYFAVLYPYVQCIINLIFS